MARRLAIGSVQLSDRAPRIVAAGGEADLEALVGAAGADLIELRADLCEDPRPATLPAAALLGLVDRAEALGADLTKLVTHARNLGDLRVLLEVTLVARARGIVTLATGPAGPLSRVVLPAAGSLLTYGHVGRPTAPSGQLPIAELAALLRRLLPPQ